MNELTSRLKQARASLGINQQEMAAAIGGNFRSWQGYEAGKSIPGGKVFAALVRLGFNGTWLLTGEGPMRAGDAMPDTQEVGMETVLQAYRMVEEWAARQKQAVSPDKKERLVRYMCSIVAKRRLERREGAAEQDKIIHLDDFRDFLEAAI